MFVCLNLIELFLLRNISAKIFYQQLFCRNIRPKSIVYEDEEFDLILHVIAG